MSDCKFYPFGDVFKCRYCGETSKLETLRRNCKALAAQVVKRNPLRCKFLGELLRREECQGCRGNVERKIYACQHPLIEETSLKECQACDFFRDAGDKENVSSLDQIIETRWAICEACDHRAGRKCRVDGGNLRSNVGNPSASCPEKKWGPEMPTVKGSGTSSKDDFRALRHNREQHIGFQIGQYVQTPPLLFSRDGHNLWLGDSFRGASCFLVCSGPSLALLAVERIPLVELNQRGVLFAAVNHAIVSDTIRKVGVRPQLWFTVDQVGKFSEAIWRDPTVWKFVPFDKAEEKLRRWNGQSYNEIEERAGDMPATFFYRRNEDFQPDQWLFESTVNWGQHSATTDAEGLASKRSVMLPAFRLLFWLGVRCVYLLGCDFKMDEARPYDFAQSKDAAGVRQNTTLYSTLNQRFEKLRPHFDKYGFSVWNCTKDSGLTAFPYKDFSEAAEDVLGNFPPIHVDEHYKI